jgi:hypothetical protein
MAKSSNTKDGAPATSDAYTGMLAIALVALIVGCVLLYLDYQQYPEKTPPPPKYSAPSVGAPAPKAAAPEAPPAVEKKEEAK